MCWMAGSCSIHYACLSCRKVFRDQVPTLCPDCRAPMRNMGPYFKAPRRHKLDQWAKIKVLAEHGIDFRPPSCCTWDGPGYRPARLSEVPEFVASQRPVSRATVAVHIADARHFYRNQKRRRSGRR